MGVEAGGLGLDSGKHGASLARGTAGILHGSYSYVLQDEDGQIQEAHSVAAGLDYPSVGPEHAFLKDSGRVEYTSATDDEALAAFQALSRLEGIIPALESAHAIAYLLRTGTTASAQSDVVVVSLSGRGDKDVYSVAGDAGGEAVSAQARAGSTEAFRQAGHPLLIPYAVGGYPDRESCSRILRTYAEAGAGIIEIGMPFSDPLADGPVIQAASQVALRQRHAAGRRARPGRRGRGRTGVPVVLAQLPQHHPGVRPERVLRRLRAQRRGRGGGARRAGGGSGRSAGARPGSAGWTWSCWPRPPAPSPGLRASRRRPRGSSTASRPPGSPEPGPRCGPTFPSSSAGSGGTPTLPLAVGFGVSTAEQAGAVARYADGVIIGSALVDMVAKSAGVDEALPECGRSSKKRRWR